MTLRVLGCVAAIALLALSPAQAEQQRSLRVAHPFPLQLRGQHFYAGESVRVTVHMGTVRRSLSTRSDGHGAFSVTFDGLRLQACATPLTLTARGARGDDAAARMPLRECAPG